MKNFKSALALTLIIGILGGYAMAGRNGSGTYTAPSNSWNPVGAQYMAGMLQGLSSAEVTVIPYEVPRAA